MSPASVVAPETRSRAEPILLLERLRLEVPERVLVAEADLHVRPGEVVALLGPSGCGKSTLLNAVGGIVTPASGRVVVAGVSLTEMPESARAAFRLRRIGMVFQFSELLPELRVVENVALPLLLAGTSRGDAALAAERALNQVGLAAHGDRMPDSLSGGEAQRAAIARAVVAQPPLVLADEPTGALDEANSRVVGNLLRGLAERNACAVVVGTHDPVIAAFADRTMQLTSAALVPVSP